MDNHVINILEHFIRNNSLPINIWYKNLVPQKSSLPLSYLLLQPLALIYTFSSTWITSLQIWNLWKVAWYH